MRNPDESADIFSSDLRTIDRCAINILAVYAYSSNSRPTMSSNP